MLLTDEIYAVKSRPGVVGPIACRFFPVLISLSIAALAKPRFF